MHERRLETTRIAVATGMRILNRSTETARSQIGGIPPVYL